ncbi:MAG: single-stranded-DNA-specific exonuclease RecJ [Firmicutes bacterium]|nr:single-stranded-DNA-specific exonuclease RecJ [Bacillota bacterium]
MQEKIWKYRDKQLKREEISDFAKKFNLPYELAVLLLLRGIKSDVQISSYMSKNLDTIHNPFLLNDMDKACERIVRAISEKEKITVFGDYDVDGITSTTVLTDFLSSIGACVDYYIPDRFSEGYGLNILALNKIARAGTKLLITVDCGIASIGEIEFAKTQKLDVIVTDHHTCKDELPKALAVINPKRADSNYPFSGLAGVGVAFKLILALAKKYNLNTKDIFMKYADLVSIGTVADVVPLLDENRTIVARGIEIIKNTQNLGIRALLEVSGCKDREITSSPVAFSLAPRINAAGRMEKASLAVELFKAKSYAQAITLAEHLDSLNRLRQETERNIFEDALLLASKCENPLVYVLKAPDWHNGVIGIVASKLCEKLLRPCILLSEENGKCKGSGRSINGFNLFDALSDSEDILTAFGGHAQAAGMTVSEDNVLEFTNRINQYAKKHITDDMLIPKLSVDCIISPSHITLEWAKALKKLEPFGESNETPVFALLGAKIISSGTMGSNGQHLFMKLQKETFVFSAVGFGMGESYSGLLQGDIADIAFTMNINTYNGTESVQLFIKDIKKSR